MPPSATPAPSTGHPSHGTVLVVDDDEVILRVCTTVLRRAGYEALPAQSAADALRTAMAHRLDAVLCDIVMPGVDGMELITQLRTLDGAMPVVLMTGSPTLETALSALEHGVISYLTKPFGVDALVKVVGQAVRRRRGESDSALHHRRLDRGLAGLELAYQPIVRFSTRNEFAFEALLRCHHPEIRAPGEVLESAEATGRLHELGRAIRERVAVDAEHLPDETLLFVNLHPEDLKDEQLYDRTAPLAQLAGRVVLEITERASVLHLEALSERIRALRDLGYRVAVDDLGAGYAGLSTLARVEPEFIKLDSTLVRNIVFHPTQQMVVTAVMELARQLKGAVIAEAVETNEERRALAMLGIDLMQGYYFARPSRPFIHVPFSSFEEHAFTGTA